MYSLELSSTLGSFRILSTAQSAGDLAQGLQKIDISKIQQQDISLCLLKIIMTYNKFTNKYRYQPENHKSNIDVHVKKCTRFSINELKKNPHKLKPFKNSQKFTFFLEYFLVAPYPAYFLM